MRRFVAIILAILVMALPCIPCADAAAAHSCNAGSVITVKGVKKQVHLPADDKDDCSPFCSCSCCSGITMPPLCSVEIKQPAPPANRAIDAHVAARVQSIALPVWQPPQLV